MLHKAFSNIFIDFFSLFIKIIMLLHKNYNTPCYLKGLSSLNWRALFIFIIYLFYNFTFKVITKVLILTYNT